jgi:uncharacterized protein YcfJ
MKTQLTLSIAGLVLVAACADSGANYQPILDGRPTSAYKADLAACQALARDQFDQETLGATVLGAGVGAALGEADSGDALGGAVAGALTGGIASAVDVSERREAIIVECLRGRGHRVVG